MAEKVSTLLRRAVKAASKMEGREEAALAVASTVAKIALGAATRLPWDRPLKSARFGLKRPADIRRLKANLARLLPEAKDWIEAAPISPDNTLSAVADLVATAKRGLARPAQNATYGIPAILVTSDLTEARSRVANLLGKSFAEKVSDRFVYRAGVRMKISPAADVAADPTALVLEFEHGREALPEAPVVPTRESGSENLVDLVQAAIRGKEVDARRTRFYSQIAAMRADLERAAAPAVATRESGGENVEPPTEVCWLNGTIQVMAKPGAVAHCAEERTVERIGLPRFLEREMDVTIPAIGAIAFRQANACDGAGIRIAVIDGESDVNHPALAGRIVHKRNFTKEPWGAPDPHGTAIAGILCSSNSLLGGACPAATILNYKVFTTNAGLQGTDFSAAVAIQSALEDGARIANLSWGLGLGLTGDSREARAVNRAWRLGLVLVKSAGNRGPDSGTMTSPADAKDVLVVGATSRDGSALEPYSSRGPNGARQGPDFLAPGASIGAQLQGLLLDGKTGSAGWGTSYAAPHAAGLIALLLSRNPALRPDDIRTLLVGKCTPIGGAAAAAQGLGFLKL